MRSPICRAENLNLVYKKYVHKPKNLRDSFIALLNSPLRTLRRQPDRAHVLKDVSFQIQRGDRVALLGKNGAGKTSLCRILSGIMRPTSGRIDRPINTRAIFLSQAAPFPELTGFENAQLMLSLGFPHLSNRQCLELTEEACDFTEIGGALYTPFRTYSTGMQARLLLSVATVRPADLLIIDEVFDGADIFWQKKIAQRTTDLIAKSGALVFVSHNQNLPASLCTSAIVLKDGVAHSFKTFQAGQKFYES